MPGTESSRAYWDSCIAIYLVEQREPWHSRILSRLGNLAQTRLEIVFTDLNRLECRTAPLAWNRLDMVEDYDAFFASSGMVWRPMATEVFDLATEFRARHRLKTPDALHLAAAVQFGCDEFWTNDLRLVSPAAGRIEIIAFTD